MADVLSITEALTVARALPKDAPRSEVIATLNVVAEALEAFEEDVAKFGGAHFVSATEIQLREEALSLTLRVIEKS